MVNRFTTFVMLTSPTFWLKDGDGSDGTGMKLRRIRKQMREGNQSAGEDLGEIDPPHDNGSNVAHDQSCQNRQLLQIAPGKDIK